MRPVTNRIAARARCTSRSLSHKVSLDPKMMPGIEPTSSRVKLEFPARPMLGCIGVAAPGDFAPTSAPAGSYGGNLDYNEVVEGAKVIFPVYHPGALLFIGDGHALMADGEPTGTGVETSMDVEFSVEVKKNTKIHWTAPGDIGLFDQRGRAARIRQFAQSRRQLPRPEQDAARPASLRGTI